MEAGESVPEALKREVLEETGYHVEPGRFFGVYSAPSEDDVVLFFEAIATSREPWQADEEIAQVDVASASTKRTGAPS